MFGSSDRLWRRSINVVRHKGQIFFVVNARVSKVRGELYQKFRCYLRRYHQLFADKQNHHLIHLNGCGDVFVFIRPVDNVVAGILTLVVVWVLSYFGSRGISMSLSTSAFRVRESLRTTEVRGRTSSSTTVLLELLSVVV